jgi:hypothetical protein
MRVRVLLLAATMLAAIPAARADEISDAITEAGRSWQSGDAVAARSALEEALQLLAQRAAAGLGEALPAALPGWTAEEAETSAATGLFGGATQASRTYRNDQEQEVRIQFTSDNPMISQMATVYSNPALAGSMGKLIRIGSQRAIQTSDQEIQMLVDNRILVTIQGDAPLDAKLAYARAIDVAKLTSRR